jgi:hypothetical protein
VPGGSHFTPGCIECFSSASDLHANNRTENLNILLVGMPKANLNGDEMASVLDPRETAIAVI